MTFKINQPIDWDKFFQFTTPKNNDAFEPCDPDCGCADEAECDDKEELRLAIAEAAFSLAEANRVLADLIDRIYGDQ